MTHATLATAQAQLGDAEGRAAALGSEKESLLRDAEISAAATAALEAEKSGLLERVMAGEEALADLRRTLAAAQKRMHDQQQALQELAADHSQTRRAVAEQQSRKWESDKDVKHCVGCESKFGAAKRKHHCRNCGRIFCKNCSSQRVATAASKDPVRVCNGCFDKIRNS